MNIINKKFNSWTVLSFSRKDKFCQPYYLCQCDCGRIKEVNGYQLISGKSQCCRGCACKKKFSTHSKSNSRLFRIWQNMKQRCYNKNHPKYSIYGKRGISICKEWLSDFSSFYDWSIQNDYQDSLTLDRIDTNGNYNPDNCRWTTTETQANNKRNNHLIQYQGNTFTVAEFCRKYNQKYSTISRRTRHLNTKDGNILLNPPPRRYTPHSHRATITYNNITKERIEWCRELGISEDGFCSRKYRNNLTDAQTIEVYLKKNALHQE